MDGVEERFTTFEGRPLRYVIGGSGPAMLLCHGFIGSAENFKDWFPDLLPRRTLVIPDLPGFGKSAPLRGEHVATSMARAALSAVDDAGIDRFDVGGLCLGATVALSVQRARPRAIERVVLHTPLLAPWLVRKRFHAQVGFMLAPGVFPGIVWLSRQRLVSDVYKRLMIEGANVDRVAAQVNFENQLRANTRAVREWLRDGLRRDDLTQVCAGEQHTMVLVAAEDRIVDVSRLRRALGGLRGVDLAVIEEGGHAWTESMIKEQGQLLAAFLDDRPLPKREDATAA